MQGEECRERNAGRNAGEELRDECREEWRGVQGNAEE
jgi:hypothetical protein